MVYEGLLHRMKLLSRRQPLDGRDLVSVCSGGEHHARVHPSPIQVDGAGTTFAEVAALLRPGERQSLPQETRASTASR
jgi:hypothetical protein